MKLRDVAGNILWQEVEHAAVHVYPGQPKHANWRTCLVSVRATQELGCLQLPGRLCRPVL